MEMGLLGTIHENDVRTLVIVAVNFFDHQWLLFLFFREELFGRFLAGKECRGGENQDDRSADMSHMALQATGWQPSIDYIAVNTNRHCTTSMSAERTVAVPTETGYTTEGTLW